ncbi:hypothetical protein VE03_10780, partial [Pseudogymnoascus sp. 23342-1-I1]
MPQLFRLAAPRILHALNSTGDLGGILFQTSPSNLVHLLLTPIKPKINAYSSNATTAPPTEPQGFTEADIIKETAVTFCNLPIEIHRLICEHIDD